MATSYRISIILLIFRKPLPWQPQVMWKLENPGQRSLRKGRHSQKNGVYFVTTSTNARIPWFQEFTFAQIACTNLSSQHGLSDAENLCWVVMPDHIHMLLKAGATPLHKVIDKFKSRTARLLNREIGRTGRFWSPGFYDHALRKEEDLLGVARYIVANPLRAGLVKRYGDYPYWNAVWL